MRISVDLALEPSAAFNILFDELAVALARVGLELEPGPGGRVVERGVQVGKVQSWQSGKHILVEWHQADWKPDETTKVEIRFEPIKNGTRVTVEHHDWGSLLNDPGWRTCRLVRERGSGSSLSGHRSYPFR